MTPAHDLTGPESDCGAAGYDAAWREDLRASEVHVGWEDDDLHVVTVRDRMGLLTDVTTAVPASDEWFEDAYDRLGRAYDLFEHR